MARKQLGVRKIALLYQNDAFGTTVLEGVKRALAQYHSAPVALGTFERNIVAVEQGLAKVRAADPDAVIVVGPYTPVNVVLRPAHAAGWHPRFLTVSFVGTEGLLRIGPQAAEGLVITQVVPPYDRTDLPTVKLYRDALAKGASYTAPSFVSLEGFVDAMVLMDALRDAGRDLTREKFISALENIHQKNIGLGPDLTLGFSPTSHQGLHSVYVTVIKDGQPITRRRLEIIPAQSWLVRLPRGGLIDSCCLFAAADLLGNKSMLPYSFSQLSPPLRLDGFRGFLPIPAPGLGAEGLSRRHPGEHQDQFVQRQHHSTSSFLGTQMVAGASVFQPGERAGRH